MERLLYEKVDEAEVGASDDEKAKDGKTLDDIIDAYSKTKSR